MIEGYVPMNRRHDDFYERFVEQRIQKLNNPEKSGKDDLFRFLLNLCVQLRLHLLRKESVILTVTL